MHAFNNKAQTDKNYRNCGSFRKKLTIKGRDFNPFPLITYSASREKISKNTGNLKLIQPKLQIDIVFKYRIFMLFKDTQNTCQDIPCSRR